MKFNLPSSETSNLFETKLETTNFEKILQHVDREQLSIFRDLDKLEEIYLLLNIDKFEKKEFRIHLLNHAFGNTKFKKFCLQINQSIISKNSSDLEKQKFVNKIATFDWADNFHTHAFVESFDLDEGIIPKEKSSSENIEMIEQPISTYSPMFFYQDEIWNAVKEKLSETAGRAIMQLPTGGGKTKVSMEIVTDFFNNNSNSTVVWLAQTSELLEQAINEFKQIWKHRGNSSISINRAWGKNDVIPEIEGSKLVVGGLSKMISFFKKNGKMKADLIIFDEAHHASAEKYYETLLDLGIPGKTKVLGLTATPGRGNEKETEELVKVFNDNSPIQINTHDEYLGPIGFLQKQGVLSKIRTGGDKIIKIPKLDVELTKAEINKLLKTSEYNDLKILKKIGQSHIRNVIIFKKLYELMNEDKQIIYFGTSVEQAKLMYVLLNNFNFKVGFVDAQTSPEYRAELIRKFQKKEIKCLLNYAVLIAGFDAPSIDTVFIGRLTKSANTLFQMIGRGMRGPSVVGGTKFCDVYHVQDKFLERFQNYEQLYETYDAYYEREQF